VTRRTSSGWLMARQKREGDIAMCLLMKVEVLKALPGISGLLEGVELLPMKCENEI